MRLDAYTRSKSALHNHYGLTVEKIYLSSGNETSNLDREMQEISRSKTQIDRENLAGDVLESQGFTPNMQRIMCHRRTVVLVYYGPV